MSTATMVTLISSYADNKGALGRRYGEWAVSGPTVEAAVAAAAMAQDELGHARSTYPVLAKLGHPRAEDGLDTSHALPMLRQELPDWASMIAANLVIDGILTTWIASARESAIEPLAQRARKILQEEGAHKVHAESWARRHCPSGGRHQLQRRKAVAAGMLACGPDEVRRQVRDWLTALLAAEGCAVELP
jgi:1,2-phenylacetyl-CoA epoxidase catalytic subunit